MYTATPSKIIFVVCGFMFAVPSVFVAYYTMRMIYMNLTMENAASHRSGGMLIGAIAFPLAAIIFGFISWLFIKKLGGAQVRTASGSDQMFYNYERTH